MKLALMDLDGVLCDDRHRVQHALAREWFKYFDPKKVILDKVHPAGRAFVESLQADGWTIAYLTGRRDSLRSTSSEWLWRNGFPQGDLLMRPIGVTVPLAVLKADIIEAMVDSKVYENVILFDDDPEVNRVVSEQVGPRHAFHCTWHIKEKALVKKATS